MEVEALLLVLACSFLPVVNSDTAACYSWTEDGRGKYTAPLDNDPTLMSAEYCAVSCKMEEYQYSALEDGSYCFCGQARPESVSSGRCPSSCPVGSTKCGDGLAVFTDTSTYPDSHPTVSSSPTTVRLIATPSTAVANGAPIQFTVLFDGASNENELPYYSFDYGDGTPTTDFQSRGAPANQARVYRTPGEFVVMVRVKATNDILRATTRVKVEPKMDVNMDCPKTAQPNEKLQCTITAKFGRSLTFTDENGRKVPILDPAYFWTPISQGFDQRDGVFVARDATFDDSGQLLGVEFGHTIGMEKGFTVKLACPDTGNSTNPSAPSAVRYCPANRNQAYCSPGDQCFDTLSSACVSSTQPPLRYTSLSTITPTSNSAYSYVDLASNATRVSPGCTVAIELASGSTALDPAFFVRAFASRPTTAKLDKTWTSPGEYAVNVAATDARKDSRALKAKIAVGIDDQAKFDLWFPQRSRINSPTTYIASGNVPKSLRIDFGDGEQSTITSRQFTHTYTKSGTFAIAVDGSGISFRSTITIDDCACCPPSLFPLAMSVNPTIPTRFTAEQTIVQSVLVTLNCPEHTRNDKVWSVYPMKDASATRSKRAAASSGGGQYSLGRRLDIANQNDSILRLSPWTLPFGRYAVVLTVSIVDANIANASITGFVTITPASLIAVIYKNQSRIAVRPGATLTFNPRDESIDPNTPPGGQQVPYDSFVWTCGKLGDDVSSDAVAEDATIGEWIRNCVGQSGPRRLRDISMGSLQLDTSQFRQNVSYLLTLTVSKTYQTDDAGGRTVLTNTAQLIVDVLDSGDSVNVHIQCAKPDLCYPTNSALRFNPSNSYLLNAKCDNCDCAGGAGTTRWSLDPMPDRPEAYLSGSTSWNLNIDRTLFFLDSLYTTLDKFTVQFTYECGSKRSYSSIDLVRNQPPIDGRCTVSSKTIVALTESLHIQCTGWYDSDGVAEYCVYVKVPGKRKEIGLFCATELAHDVYLEEGTYDLYVNISDRLMAVTRKKVARIQVSASNTSLDESSFLADLRTAIAEHNLVKTLSFVKSVARTANDRDRIPGLDDFWTQAKCTNGSDLERCRNMNVSEVGRTVSFDIYQECLKKANNCDAEYRSRSSSVRSVLVRAVDAFEPSTLGDVTAFANALNTIVAKTDQVNLEGQESAIELLDKMRRTFDSEEGSAPPELVRDSAQAMFELTVNMNQISHESLTKDPILYDQLRIQKDEYDNYDTSLPEDPRDIRFVDEMTFEEWGIDSAKRAQRKLSARLAASIQSSLDSITTAVLRDTTPDRPPITFKVAGGGLMELTYARAANISLDFQSPGGVRVQFPEFCQLINADATNSNSSESTCGSDTPVQRKAVYYAKNLYKYADRDEELTSGSTEIEFLDPSTGKSIPVTQSSAPIVLRFAQSSPVNLEPVVPILNRHEAIKVHRISAKSTPSTFRIELKPANRRALLGVFMRHGADRPDFYVGTYSDEFDQALVLGPRQYTATVTLQPMANQSGIEYFYYIGIAQLVQVEEANGTDIGNYTVLRKFKTTYNLSISSHECQFFGPKDELWLRDGCKVSHNSTHNYTECECTHLTVFAAGLIVPPNDIDFNYVFTHASFDENLTIYVAMLLIYVIYVGFLFWARLKDKHDLDKLGCIPMPDNDARDKYVYELVIVTGTRKAASTESKVKAIIVGDQGETEIREFGHPSGPRHMFQRGMTNRFVMTTPRPLGDLRYVRIWHDNSGPGEYAGWFLKEVAILDVQTHTKYPFVCNQWLATERGDGQIERTLGRSSDEELSRFARVFSIKAKRDLMEDHLWFSVFTRSATSRFTRVQRVTCCLALLTTSMLASAMWYGRVPSGSPGLKSGPFSMSTSDIGVGIMTSLIVFPPNFLVILLFRKAGPRRKQQSRIEKVLKDSSVSMAKSDGHPKKKKHLTFPWWVRGVAWVVLVLVIAASTVFTIFYAIQLQDAGTRKWLTSMVVSFFTSILITEPMQIFLLAIFFALVCRKKAATGEEPDWIVDQEDIALHYAHHGWSDGDGFKGISPLDEQYMESKKQDRLKQLRMYDVVRETATYGFFLWVIFVLVYGSRDTNSYNYKNNLETMFLRPRHKYLDFQNKIREVSQFWTWTREALAPGLHASTWYNGQRPALGELGFLADRTNRMMGHATMRQVRSVPRTCTTRSNSIDSNKTTSICADPSYTNYFNEDSKNYTRNWSTAASVNSDEKPSEYTFRTADSLQNMPTSGLIDYYSGGGYVLDLYGSIRSLQENFARLEQDGWIDRNTRAVIIEFSCFDANANMFGVNFIMAEFPYSGGIVPSATFKPLVLLPYNSGFALLQIILQVIFVLFILIYLVKEVRKMISEGVCKYLRRGWNYVELFIIIFSLAAVGAYLFRYLETNRCLTLLEETHGDRYISLQYASAFDETFTSVAAFLVFFAVTKFAHLLRFNHRISVMHTTFARCRKYFVNYSVVFGILFLGFCMTFYVLFHAKFSQYSSFVRTLETAFTFLLSHGDYLPLSVASPMLGPIFIVMFTVVMIILMVNVFLTSVMSIFIRVKHDSRHHEEEHEVVSFFLIKTRHILGLSPVAEQRTAIGDYRNNNSNFYDMEKRLAKIMRKVDNMCLDHGLKIAEKLDDSDRIILADVKQSD